MSTDLGPEFLEKYNGISNKLKKRFMRKPNVSEATEEFSNLALQCDLSEQPPFAGLCYLGAARCEGSIGNSMGEAEYLLMSARQFMKAELKLSSLKCLSPGRENLEAAISCYSHASSRFPDNSPIKACISLELADNLVSLGHLKEAIQHYQISVENYSNNAGHTLNCFSKMGSIYIKLAMYSEALHVFMKITKIANEHNYRSHIERCEINKLLLYLLVQPSTKTYTGLENIHKIYSLENIDSVDNEESVLHPELFLHLQSVYSACKMADKKTLLNLQTEMKNFLSIEQQDLMRELITTYDNMI